MLCRYCHRKTRGEAPHHVHCHRASRKAERVSRGEIQEPKTDEEAARFSELIALRKLGTGEVPFIRSRIPQDQSSAAEIALRPEGSWWAKDRETYP